MTKRESYDGRGKRLCSKCGWHSLKGMRPGGELCPFHWCEELYGTDWAKRCHPTYVPKPKPRP